MKYPAEQDFIQVVLPDDGSFLKIKETLRRIGMGSYKTKELTATCNILQKKGLYYIVHFKEMLLLDGKEPDITPEDNKRRNTIAYLLSEWGLLNIVDPRLVEDRFSNSKEGGFRVIPYKEFKNWTAVSLYTIGEKTHD